MTTLHLPPMPEDAPPVIVPGLLTGIGVVRRQVPAWITDPDVIESITCGFIDLPDEEQP